MKNKAYYHIYLPDDYSWAGIFTDQMGKMLESGLMKDIDQFNVTAIGNKDHINRLSDLLGYYYKLTGTSTNLTWFQKNISDYDLNNLDRMKNENILSETQTLKKIREDCLNSSEPFNVLYFHAKAVTSIEKCLKRGQPERYINYIHWRKMLDYFSIIKWKESIALLENFDAVGCNYCNWPSNHFSGNYWWSNSEYIKRLSDPTDEEWWKSYKDLHTELYKLPDRLVSEMWIGSGKDADLYSFYFDKTPPPISNLGERIIFTEEYE